MHTNLHRLNSVVPGSARHIARAQAMEDVIEELAQNQKLVEDACRGFRRIEKALYYLNRVDRPTVEVTRRELAARTRCAFATIHKDLVAINELFDAIGLRLQHWESGGWRTTDGVEETVPSVYHWPSPGGRIIEESNEKIELSIANKIIPGRDEQAERRIIKEMILKEIDNPYMQELRRERRDKKIVREARATDKADDKARAQAEAQAPGKVVEFPAGRPPTPTEAASSSVASFKASGISDLAEAIRLLAEQWQAEQ